MKLWKRVGATLAALCTVTAVVWALPFLFLQAGFTQEVYGTSSGFMGGVAFAPDGDVWVTPCAFGGGNLRRFDAQTTTTVNGTTVHPLIATVASNTGCGLVNHPNGSLYSNTGGGVTRQNGDTGAPIGVAFGSAGNALGIAVDPRTLELAYVGSNGDIFAVDPDFTTSRTLSSALAGFFIDGIFFDPSGDFLFTSVRTGGFRVGILDPSDGSIVQEVPLPSEPDGIAFHATTPRFVVTSNTDGTMTRLDFPGDDFTQAPVVTLFASGGFRGDLSQVGPDGCLYLTQNGTRFDDGTTSSADSVVRICGGFAPGPGVGSITLTPPTAVNLVGETHTVTAHVVVNMMPAANVDVAFEVMTGPHAGTTGMGTTDMAGDAMFSYVGTMTGIDEIQASFVDGNGTTQVSNVVTKEWVAGECVTLDFDTEDDGTTPLVNGQHIDVEFGNVVTLSSSGANAGLGIFDSTPMGPNDPSQDLDLLIGTGNLLILQTENLPPDGSDVFPRPNDDDSGGTVTFSFAGAVAPMSIRMVDIDGPMGASSVVLTDAAGAQRTFAVPANWTGDRTLGDPGHGTLDLATLAPQMGFGSTVTASEDAGFDPEGVVRMDVNLGGSAAIDDVSWCPPGGVPARTQVVVRNGSGTNPIPLRSLAGPTVGGAWDLSIDCTGNAPGLAVVSFRSQAVAGTPIPAGELLIGGSTYLMRLVPHGGALAHAMQGIPSEPSLCGVELHVQSACLGSPGPRLSNALDVTLGY